MTISWDKPYKQKYLSFQKTEWDRGDYKFIAFERVPLGWTFNISRFCVSYDNYGKVDSK